MRNTRDSVDVLGGTLRCVDNSWKHFRNLNIEQASNIIHFASHTNVLDLGMLYYIRWCDGAIGRASDLRLVGRRIESFWSIIAQWP